VGVGEATGLPVAQGTHGRCLGALALMVLIDFHKGKTLSAVLA